MSSDKSTVDYDRTCGQELTVTITLAEYRELLTERQSVTDTVYYDRMYDKLRHDIEKLEAKLAHYEEKIKQYEGDKVNE